jgi:regulator of protease activity HflC (stomatin/prohibitin superfamily)
MLIIWLFIIFAAMVLIGKAVKIVKEYERLVIFRVGNCIGQKGPGIVLLWPFIDIPVRVDQREFFLEIPKQTCITKDNAPINIDFLIYFKVLDPVPSVVQVLDFSGASQGLATTTLRAVVGDISLDDVLAKRDQINQVLRVKLDEVTERWGVKVTTVEIREIVPPKDVMDAMTRQMSAERGRRAVVTEAEGARASAILKAEGDKLAAILKAEGDKQAAVLRAEGYALALTKTFEAASKIDSKTMNLQYLDALKNMGASAATKYVIPMEFTNLIRPFINYGQESTK